LDCEDPAQPIAEGERGRERERGMKEERRKGIACE